MKATKSTATGSSARRSRFSCSAHSIAAIGPLVSQAPRPHNLPSRRSPPNGSMVMPPTPTVSRCGPNKIRGRPSSGAKRAIRFGRPGRISSSITSAPIDSSQPARNMARVCSPVIGGARRVVGIDRGDADKLLEQRDHVLAHGITLAVGGADARAEPARSEDWNLEVVGCRGLLGRWTRSGSVARGSTT